MVSRVWLVVYNGNVYPTLSTPLPNKGDSSLIYNIYTLVQSLNVL